MDGCLRPPHAISASRVGYHKTDAIRSSTQSLSQHLVCVEAVEAASGACLARLGVEEYVTDFYVEIRSVDGASIETSGRVEDFDDAFDWLTELLRDNPCLMLRIVGPLDARQRGRLC